jgi:hypothetical protein
MSLTRGIAIILIILAAVVYTQNAKPPRPTGFRSDIVLLTPG